MQMISVPSAHKTLPEVTAISYFITFGSIIYSSFVRTSVDFAVKEDFLFAETQYE